MEYAALDLETTGLDTERDRVIEVGAVTFTESAVTGTLESLANPGRSLPVAVSRLTGITQTDLAGAVPPATALRRLADFVGDRRPVGHGARLDVDFMAAAGLWPPGLEILDTLDIARILLPDAASHSLPVLALELGLAQPRPHRALDDADATRQLFLRLREEAARLDGGPREAVLALVAPYQWAIARFFVEALDQPGKPPAPGPPAPARPAREPGSPAAARPGPSRTAVDDDPHALAGLLAPGGPLARALPGYEHRESQLQMLLAVAQTMQRGGTLVAEAGTGTGKSLAYLVPAIARALRRGERVLISTHTHTLQEQLMAKDIPALREWLPWDFEACLLKGRANYLSPHRWRTFLAEPCGDAEELRFKLKVVLWLHRTPTGDRSELRLQGREEALWARVASDPLDCAGAICRGGPDPCFVHRARAEADRADVVVVNHALLLADAGTGGNLLPAYDHLVIDEAHHLEDAATQGLRCEIDSPGFETLLDQLADARTAAPGGLLRDIQRQPHLGSSSQSLVGAEALALAARARVATLFETAAGWVQHHLPVDTGRREDSVRLLADHRAAADWAGLGSVAGDALTALAALDSQLRRAVALSRDWLGGEEPDQALRELESVRGRLAEAADLCRQALLEPDPNRVYWFSQALRTPGLVLRSAPVNVGSLLREHVYGGRSSLVLTSASLAVAGSFDYLLSRVGLGSGVETLILASPFDYFDQALVCLPIDMPEPQAPEFEPLLEAVIADVARRLNGRTLVLFTSHRQLRDVHAALHHRADLDDVLIVGQGVDGQRRQVLRSFLESERALLLGTASFWEGIDIPGDQLSCVMIVRLPFPVPTEPVFAARAEQVRDPFSGYALPLAALRLKQGFGRLIRRSSDRGAVVILDNRISSRDYGRAFLEVLPPASQYRGPLERTGERIEEWVAGPRPAR